MPQRLADFAWRVSTPLCCVSSNSSHGDFSTELLCKTLEAEAIGHRYTSLFGQYSHVPPTEFRPAANVLSQFKSRFRFIMSQIESPD